MRILFVSPRYPYPPRRGDELRAFHLVRSLAETAQVRLLCFGSGEPLPIEGLSVRNVARSAIGTIVANLVAPDPRLPLQVRLFMDARMKRLVAEELRNWRPDVVHVTLSRMAPYLPDRGTCHRHLDLVDSLYLNMLTRSRSGSRLTRPVFALESRLMKAYEHRAAAAADSASVVTQADRDAVDSADAVVIPNGVDPAAFPFREPRGRPTVMIFFGNLGYFHNVESARFLVQRVLPLVRERVPEATLRLAGARPAAALRGLSRQPGVELVDTPPVLADEIHAAAAALIPMFSGSGMKNKVLESFCAGTPVVTNQLGIEGIDGAHSGVHYLSANSAELMATEAVRLMTDADLRVRLAAAARTLVTERYVWERQAERLLSVYSAGYGPAAARVTGP